MLLLAGPPAVGHNAIAELICKQRTRAALIDVDEVRYMQRVPYVSPWEGAEGKRQYRLGIRNACALARRFDADGSDVVMLDVAPPETLSLYRTELGSVGLSIVLLHAEGDVLIARDVERGRPTGLEPAFWHARIRELRDHLLRHADSYDHVHDTGAMSPEKSADRLAHLLDQEAKGRSRAPAAAGKDGVEFIIQDV